MNDEQIQDIVNRMNTDDIQVYKIEYSNDMFDNIDDFIKDFYECIDDECIYHKIYKDIIKSNKSKEEKIAALEQLDADKDNYSLMCLRNDISFYLTDKEDMLDFVMTEEIGDKIMLCFSSNQNYFNDFYVDFLMTPLNDDITYKKFYMWNEEKDEPLPYVVNFQGVLNPEDRFKFDTACYFNIGRTNRNRNSLDYITKFHRELIFYNVMTRLECEVAASFASQSNHNLIGRTNEKYEPIKYYKINDDDDDKFWIEFYDRNEIDISISFNDFVMFTMDVVFLQNRKLLYS